MKWISDGSKIHADYKFKFQILKISSFSYLKVAKFTNIALIFFSIIFESLNLHKSENFMSNESWDWMHSISICHIFLKFYLDLCHSKSMSNKIIKPVFQFFAPFRFENSLTSGIWNLNLWKKWIFEVFKIHFIYFK